MCVNVFGCVYALYIQLFYVYFVLFLLSFDFMFCFALCRCCFLLVLIDISFLCIHQRFDCLVYLTDNFFRLANIHKTKIKESHVFLQEVGVALQEEWQQIPRVEIRHVFSNNMTF